MEIDVWRLAEMHPRLAETTVADLLHKVAIGLARHDHRPGGPCELDIADAAVEGVLRWAGATSDTAGVFDFNRVTEDAAEAIALALVHCARGWSVGRRAQREEHADWLLSDPDDRPVALEISGVDMIDAGKRRLREKVQQVGQHANWRAIKAACIVELHPPRCRLRTA